MDWKEIRAMRARIDAAQRYLDGLDDFCKKVSEANFFAIAELLYGRVRTEDTDKEWAKNDWNNFTHDKKCIRYSYWVKATKMVNEMWEAGVSKEQIGTAILVASRYF